jgi:hypothetical protein
MHHAAISATTTRMSVPVAIPPTIEVPDELGMTDVRSAASWWTCDVPAGQQDVKPGRLLLAVTALAYVVNRARHDRDGHED